MGARGAVGPVILDCGGVLVDSEPIALRLLLDTLGRRSFAMTPGEAEVSCLGRKPRLDARDPRPRLRASP